MVMLGWVALWGSYDFFDFLCGGFWMTRDLWDRFGGIEPIAKYGFNAIGSDPNAKGCGIKSLNAGDTSLSSYAWIWLLQSIP